MAKEKTAVLTELKSGKSGVVLIGKAKIRDGAFGEETQKEGKTWRQVDSSFGVDTGEGNVVYGRIWGGYKTDVRKTSYQDSETKKYIQIKWEDRLKESIIEKANPYSLLEAKLEKDSEGKFITKKFLHEIDFSNYLAEHLQDGADVRVRAEAEYSEYNGNINRRFSITGVYLNEPYEKDGEMVQTPPMAQLRQTYMIDDSALESGWERKLAKDGTITARVFVPQYVSQMNVDGKRVEIKRTIAFPQGVTIKVDVEDEKALESKTKIVKKYFVVKKGTVREVECYVDINEGYDESTGVELNDEMRELIEMGMLTEEDIKKQTTIRGNKVSEITFSKPVVKVNEEGSPYLVLEDNKYAPEALFPPQFDNDEDDVEDGLFDATDDGVSSITDDAFAELFDM